MYDKIEGKVTQYPYRTALIDETILRVPRELMDDFAEKLAEAAGAMHDNYTVYMIEQGTKPPVYIMFSDFTVTFGSSVIKRRW